MRTRAITVGIATLALTSCATGDSFESSRSVFNNPYALPVFDNGPVGSDCGERASRLDGCFLDSLSYPGRGKFALDRSGNLIRLTRSERRFLRERHEAIQSGSMD